MRTIVYRNKMTLRLEGREHNLKVETFLKKPN